MITDNQQAMAKQGEVLPKIGCLARYQSPEELESKIREYFESCWIDKVTEVENKETGEITTSNVRYQAVPYTVAGMAHFLGFMDRQSMYDYKGHEAFSCIIKRAKLAIESQHEGNLSAGKNPAGSIFWLKNHAGYRDQVDTVHSGSVAIEVVRFGE